jgi:hypothetical protein
MLDETVALPEDPEEPRAFTARLLAEVKAQAVPIEKLRHQLAGHARHRFGASSETAEQLQLALETSEIAAATMTAPLRLPTSTLIAQRPGPRSGRRSIKPVSRPSTSKKSSILSESESVPSAVTWAISASGAERLQ